MDITKTYRMNWLETNIRYIKQYIDKVCEKQKERLKKDLQEFTKEREFLIKQKRKIQTENFKTKE